MMKVALVSEHASPLATLGGVDAGGQNVHVAALATSLAKRGAIVTVFTRRDSRDLPATVAFGPGVDVVHIDAGPPCAVPKDDLLPHMDEFGHAIARSLAPLPARRGARPLLDVRPCRARRRTAAGHPDRAHLPRAGSGEAPSTGMPRHEPAGPSRDRSALGARDGPLAGDDRR